MFNVYYIRGGYALNAHFDESESAMLFASNFVYKLGGDYAAVTNTETHKTVQIYSRW